MSPAGHHDTTQDATASKDAQRLDKWLWFARIAKTRTQAAALVSSGKIKVNKERVTKPSHLVKPGDVITSTARKWVQVLRVVAAGSRRGPASEAAALFVELTERAIRPIAAPPLGQIGAPADAPSGVRPRGAGRPTKRDRRRIDRLLGGH